MSSEHALSEADRSRLDHAADEFHAALSQGRVSDWQTHLTRLPEHLRVHGLIEFAILELGHRWQSGERPTVEEYVARHPDLGPRDRVNGKLIAEEYLQRLTAGEPRNVSQYAERFPVQYPGIQSKLLAIETDRPMPRVNLHSDTQLGPTPEVAPSQAGAKSSDYQFVRRLGSGAFGEVWLARTTKTGIDKAIKILHKAADEDVARRELRSLELIKNLRHPYLLNTEDYWVSENRLYVVMELADGTLKSRMKECQEEGQPGIPDDELFVTMCEAAEGLDFLHEQNVTHRDVKPDNILLLRGHAKVADFGLARQQEQMIAQMSVFAGSPAYMAPEVWSGDSGPGSDLYSFAITYLELLQGRLPVKLGPVTEIMFAHLEGRFEFDLHIGDAERAAFLKALAKDPADRYGSCAEFMEALANATHRPFVRPSAKRKTGVVSHPKIRGLAGPSPSQTVATATSRPQSGTYPPLAQQTQSPTTTRQSGTFRPATLTSGTSTTSRSKRPRPTRRWVPAVIAGGLLTTIVGLIAAVFLTPSTPPSGTGSINTSSPPTTEQTRPTSTPPTSKPPETVWSPPGTAGVPGTETELNSGRKVFKWVTATVQGQPVQFRLIPGGNPDNTSPFYISEEKISARAFRGTAPVGGEPTAPATGMTVAEAAQFVAKQFPSGRLPTPAEWDHAAGFHQPPSGDRLDKPGSVPWVNHPSPSPSRKGAPTADVNSFDLLDMNGNGREWTCGVLVKRGTPPEIADRLTGQFSPDDLVILRGQNFSSEKGLTRVDLGTRRTADPLTQLAGKGSPYTGFRVVLPGPS